MIFDKFCRVVERSMPGLVKTVDQARLFHFPGRPHEFLPKELDDKTVEFLSKEFMLPFPCVCVEDTAGAVFLIDFKKNIKGINKLRAYIDIVPFHTPASEFGDINRKDEKQYNQLIKEHPDAQKNLYIITAGELEEIKFVSGKDFYSVGSLRRVIVAAVDEHRPKNIILKDASHPNLSVAFDPRMLQQHLEASLKNAMTAVQEILYANTPNKFIMQSKPTRLMKKKPGKLLRSTQRPIYTILKPNEIRKIMKIKINSGSGGTRGAHDRRAHPRTFHSEFYKEMQGKTIMIPATWVGPSEAKVGKRRYKVMLNM
ncbi:MAG: hypothetical protein R3250_13890 [Melioribacteraceae bacterium]|nr:hypothetical protein [Melioribacteraceae bacterium]